MEAARVPWPALGVLLVRDALVTVEQLEEVLEERQDSRENRLSSHRLGEALVERGYVTREQVARLVAEQHELPFIDLTEPDAMVPLAGQLPEELASRLSALPIRIFPDGSLLIVVADPTTPGIYDEIRRAVSVPIRLAVAAPDLIELAIDNAYTDQRFGSAEAVDVTETLDARDEESAGSETGLYLAGAAEGAEPPVTSGQNERGWRVLGSLLLRDGLVTELELETALAQQRLSSTRRLGEILIQRGAVTETQVARALAEQHELPFVDLAEHELDLAAAARLPIAFAREYRMLPVSHLPGGGSLLVVTADPARAVQSDELRALLDCPFQLAVGAAEEIDAALAVVERAGQVLTSVPEPDPTPDPESVPEQDAEAEPVLALQPDPQPEWSAFPDLFADTEAESEIGLETEAETEVVAEAANETVETEMESDSGPETVMETEVVAEAANETVEPEMESDGGPETVMETEVVAEAANETVEPEMESDGRPEAVMETEVVAQAPDETVETDMDSDSGPQAEVVAQATDETAEPEMDSDSGPETEMETEVVAQAPDETVETEIESDTGPETEMKTEVVAQTNFDDEAGAEAETEVGTETEVEVAATADSLTDEVEAYEEGRFGLPAVEAGPDQEPAILKEIESALALGATAVHVVARRDTIVVHARIDGLLAEMSSIPIAEPAVTTALNALSDHGRRSFAVGGRTVELRPTVLATVQGTRVTFRLVENGEPPESLDELLGPPGDAHYVLNALSRHNGLVVLCSPTSSERRALLLSALPELVEPGRTVLSIEDSVEHLVNGVDQVDVDPGAGVTFATGLHTILRSDADVAAVGELIDPETVRLATRGALGSCLVVTTLAADSATEAAYRLLELGAERESLAEALACIAASRRLRGICFECRTSSYATLDELSVLGRPPEESGRRLLARASGCAACDGTGYSGWLRVSESLPLTDDVRHAVAAGARREEIERVAADAGMRTVADAAVELCLEGMTTASEVARATGMPTP
jgi:type II secretory ATPase GspE/PulE/Tfp pilus assembly ATPase PilB-like protein